MAFAMTIADRISFGNRRLLIYNATDAATAGSDFFPGCDVVEHVKALNNTDNADTFKEQVGAHSATSTKNKITLTPVTALDDGHVWIWVR